MAIVLDELVLILGMDASKFNTAQRAALEAFKKTQEEATKGGKEIESQGKKTLDFFQNLKREAIGLLAAFYGGRGIKEIVGHLVQLDASASRLGNIAQTSAHDIALWRTAIREVGGAAEEADSAIGSLSAALNEAALHPDRMDPNMLALFGMIGATISDSPTAILKKLAAFGQTPEMKAHPDQFAARARMLPGMNQDMIYLLLELDKRLKAAEKVTPEGGGEGAFSKEFIASIALFDTAANNIARVFLDYFIPSIQKFTDLLTKWLIPPGSAEAKAVEEHLEETMASKSMEATANAFVTWVDSLFGSKFVPKPKISQLTTEPPRGTKTSTGDTGIGGVFGGATGFSVEEGGVLVGGGTFPGAKGAAAVSNVNNSRSNRSSNSTTSSTTIGDVYVNAPNATNSRGIAANIKGHLSESLGAPINSAY